MERTTNEIERVAEWARIGTDEGSRYPGMSYEQGVMDTLNWVTGLDDHAPDEE